MLPILPFVAGVIVGASAIGLVRRAKTSQGVHDAVENAGRRIRRTAVSGLETIRQSSEQLRARLAGETDAPTPAAEPAQATEPAGEAAGDAAPPRQTTPE
ncbi:MAG: hypothetical protein LBF91_10530 [Azoarcus sp.]|jgi:hypothetical protein|nr:hypothetical protein [Azoarcus sp.]